MKKSTQRFIGATIAIFVFIFLFEWLVHGVLLKRLYAETPHAWRPMSEMQNLMPLMLLFQLAIALWLTYFYTKIYTDEGYVHDRNITTAHRDVALTKDENIRDGLMFGLYIGVFSALMSAASYVWLPITKELAVSWFITSVIEGLGCGIILGLIYSNYLTKTDSMTSKAYGNQDDRDKR